MFWRPKIITLARMFVYVFTSDWIAVVSSVCGYRPLVPGSAPGTQKSESISSLIYLPRTLALFVLRFEQIGSFLDIFNLGGGLYGAGCGGKCTLEYNFFISSDYVHLLILCA